MRDHGVRFADDDGIIGASLCGKTTIYNHLQILHGKNFSKTDRFDARLWVMNDLIDAFKVAKDDRELIQTDRGAKQEDAEVCFIKQSCRCQRH